MTYAIVIYPKIEDDSKIQNFRKKYDPYFRLIKPHITLVFPFEDMGKEKINGHLLRTINQFEKFDLRLRGLTKSFDNWIFLTAEDGNDNIIEFHDKLYTGILKSELREDIKFIPHIGLGLFENDKKYKMANNEAKNLKLDYKCRVNSVHLIHLKEDMSRIDWSKEYLLP